MNDLKSIINSALLYIKGQFDRLIDAQKGAQEVKIDLGSLGTDMQDSSKQLSRLVALLTAQEATGSKTAESLKKYSDQVNVMVTSLKETVSAIDMMSKKKGLNEGRSVEAILENSTRLRASMDLFEKHLSAANSKDHNKPLENMMAETKVALSSIASALKEIKIEAPNVNIDMDGMEVPLSLILKAVQGISSREIEALLDRIERAVKKIEMPKSFKLDGDQFRELRTVMSEGKGGASGGAALGGGVSAASTLKSGRKVVAVTDTAIALGSAACQTVFVTALVGNTDVVVIGGSDVVHTEATRTGKLMYPGDAVTISIDNLSKLFINGVANDGISFTYTR